MADTIFLRETPAGKVFTRGGYTWLSRNIGIETLVWIEADDGSWKYVTAVPSFVSFDQAMHDLVREQELVPA